MNKLFKYFLVIISLPPLLGCYPEQGISEIPRIEFRNLDYIPNPAYDSLVLSFYFEDGDGDVGLFPEETLPPFHPYDYVIDSEDSLVTLNSSSPPPFRTYTRGTGEINFLSENDTRIAFDCNNYAIEDHDGDMVKDTFFIVKNEHHYNLRLKFFRKINGVFTEIDLTSLIDEACGLTFDARIPVFDEQSAIDQRPTRGVITYPIETAGFPFILGNDPFKIEFYIYDFERNKSNVATTPELTLLGITK